MDDFQARIAEILRENQELSSTDLAKIADVSKGAVSQWLNGPAKSMSYDAAQLISRRLGYGVDWILSGKLPKRAGNTTSGPMIQGRVPIISWVQAGDWAGVVDNHQPGEAE